MGSELRISEDVSGGEAFLSLEGVEVETVPVDKTDKTLRSQLKQ